MPISLSGSLIVTGSITGSLFGTSSWATSASWAPLQGGTANYIPLWSSTSTITSSVIYQSSSYIGIGTISPLTRLHISGSATTASLRISRDGNSKAHIYGENNLILETDSDFFIGAYAARPVHINAANGANGTVYIASDGKMGIGTTSPEALLHINKSTAAGEGAFIFLDNSATSTLGNKAGIRFATNTGASFSNYGSFIEAINTNAGNGAEDLTFGTWNGAARGERLRIDYVGNVGINTISPIYKLDVSGSTRIIGSLAVGNIAPSATIGRIDASNDVVAFSTSDIRLKENIYLIENSLDKLSSIRGVTYNWIEDKKDIHGYDGKDVGVIAQEIEKILPEAIRTNETGYLAVRYEKIIPLLIEAIKEQQKQINELKLRLDGITP